MVELRSATALREKCLALLLGKDAMLHAEPFQCSLSATLEFPVSLNPTAHASVALLALTARRLATAVMEAVVTSDQALPFQWYATGSGAATPDGPYCWPTIHMSAGVRAKAP